MSDIVIGADALLDLQRRTAAFQAAQRGAGLAFTRLHASFDEISTRSIGVRTHVQRPVAAFTNCSSAVRELAEAVDRYRLPQWIQDLGDAAVRAPEGREVDAVPARTMCRAMQHLVRMKAFIEAKPSNAEGAALLDVVDELLNGIVHAAELRVVRNFVNATAGGGGGQSAVTRAGASGQPPGAAAGAPGAARGPSLFTGDVGALADTAVLLRDLLRLFARQQPVSEIKRTVLDAVKQRLDVLRKELAAVDREDRRRRQERLLRGDSAGMPQSSAQSLAAAVADLREYAAGAATRAGEDAAVWGEYRDAPEAVVAISRAARGLCREAAAALRDHVLSALPDPPRRAASALDEDPDDDVGAVADDVADFVEALREDTLRVPPDVVEVAAVYSLRLLERAVVDLAALDASDFAALPRHVDVLNEAWRWRRIARETPGGAVDLISAVDEHVATIHQIINERFVLARDKPQSLSAAHLLTLRYSEEPMTALDEAVLYVCGLDTAPDHVLSRPASRELRRWWIPPADGAACDATAPFVQGLRRLFQATYAAGLMVVFSAGPDDVDARLTEAQAAAVEHHRTAALRARKRRKLDALIGGRRALQQSDDATGAVSTPVDGDLDATAGRAQDTDEARHIAAQFEDLYDEMEGFFAGRVEGHVVRISAIADAALLAVSQAHAEKATPGARQARDELARKDPLEVLCSPGPGRLGFPAPVFRANSLSLLVRLLQARGVFDVPSTDGLGAERLGAMLASAVDRCRDAIDEAIAMYRTRWERSVLASLADDGVADIRASGGTDPLTKKQRYTCKKWYERATAAVVAEVQWSREITVTDAAVRRQFLDAVTEATLERFQQMERIVRGREWSTRPSKWLQVQVDPQSLRAAVNNLFIR